MNENYPKSNLPHDYGDFLQSIKQRIRESRIRAYRSVNSEMLDLYWNIGYDIVTRQERDGWGKAVVERLSVDLRREVPSATGFSSPNLWFMRQMYSEYRNQPNLLRLVREIPWGQNITIMTKVKDLGAREYYLRMTAEMGWSRSVLLHQIKTDAYRRHGLPVKQHNFRETLPEALAEQADEGLVLIENTDQGWRVTEPVFARWLRV